MTKKITQILFLTVFSFMVINASAQGKVYSNDKHPSAENNDAITSGVKSRMFKKASYCGWYIPTDAIEATGPQLTGYVNFLTTDSTAKMISADGSSYYNGWHLSGVCFDPKDENFSFVTDGESLSKYNPYKVDSVFFRYLYVRRKDNTVINGNTVKVVDTLIFQFHNPNNMRYATFGTAPVEKYGMPKSFSRALGGAPSATYTEKIPLTDMDSTTLGATGWRSKGMLVAIPESVAQAAALDDNNQVAFNIFFKQMVQNQPGDTFEARNGATITNTMNYAGFSLLINENQSSQVNQEIYRNNAYFTVNRQLYGGNVNGWANYIAGNAYFSARYMYSAFHLCTPNLSTKDVNQYGYGLGKISPNPARPGSDVYVEFTLGNSESATLTVSDILGNTLRTVESGKLKSGLNVMSFNTSNMASGVYFYTIQAGGFKSSKKFTVGY